MFALLKVVVDVLTQLFPSWPVVIPRFTATVHNFVDNLVGYLELEGFNFLLISLASEGCKLIELGKEDPATPEQARPE